MPTQRSHLFQSLIIKQYRLCIQQLRTNHKIPQNIRFCSLVESTRDIEEPVIVGLTFLTSVLKLTPTFFASV